MSTTHLGNSIPEDANFFVSAPGDIGEVLSQASTLKKGEAGTVPKGLIILSLGFFATAVIFAIVYLVTNKTFALVGAMLFGAFALLRLLNTKRFECNYVGDRGVARYRVGKPDQTNNSIEGGVFRFEQAQHLYTNVIETNGLHPFYGQNAIYQWVRADNKFIFSILTDQYVPSEPIEDHSVISFLRASEAAWTRYRYARAKEQLSNGGMLEFPYRRGGKAVLKSDRILLEIGKGVEILADDLVSIDHSAGNLEFKTRSGKVASHDVFHFADALLFEDLICDQFGLERYDSGIRRP